MKSVLLMIWRMSVTWMKWEQEPYSIRRERVRDCFKKWLKRKKKRLEPKVKASML